MSSKWGLLCAGPLHFNGRDALGKYGHSTSVSNETGMAGQVPSPLSWPT